MVGHRIRSWALLLVGATDYYYPHDRERGVLFFVRSTFGTMTLIPGKFEIGFSHVQDQTVAKAPRTCGGRSQDCWGSGRVGSNGIYVLLS
jgi:hypothetical protein